MKPPTLEDYLQSMRDIADLLRKALDEHGSVTRGELRRALERYERLDRQASKNTGRKL